MNTSNVSIKENYINIRKFDLQEDETTSKLAQINSITKSLLFEKPKSKKDHNKTLSQSDFSVKYFKYDDKDVVKEEVLNDTKFKELLKDVTEKKFCLSLEKIEESIYEKEENDEQVKQIEKINIMIDNEMEKDIKQPVLVKPTMQTMETMETMEQRDIVIEIGEQNVGNVNEYQDINFSCLPKFDNSVYAFMNNISTSVSYHMNNITKKIEKEFFYRPKRQIINPNFEVDLEAGYNSVEMQKRRVYDLKSELHNLNHQIYQMKDLYKQAYYNMMDLKLSIATLEKERRLVEKKVHLLEKDESRDTFSELLADFRELFSL